ncbi:hypothetical protein [Burkholderia ubonensis]|uniref:hypothetical protein n=1 Tax=Burkholderia ubonensis TaxID=101571 RepID=UPI0012FCB861|nr:hypothetical protein [Burkholderia ubonensis]
MDDIQHHKDFPPLTIEQIREPSIHEVDRNYSAESSPDSSATLTDNRITLFPSVGCEEISSPHAGRLAAAQTRGRDGVALRQNLIELMI